MKKISKSTALEVVNEHGLNPEQQKQAAELLVKFPQVEKASNEFRDAMQDAGKKYFNLCESLRDTKLNGPELTLMMRSLGYRKERISEVKRVISVSPEAWQKFKDGVLGFRAVLKEARQGVALPAGEVPDKDETEEAGGEVTPRNDKPAPKVHRFPKPMQAEIVLLLAKHPLKDTPGAEGYEMEYSVKNEDGTKRSFRLWLEVETTQKK